MKIKALYLALILVMNLSTIARANDFVSSENVSTENNEMADTDESGISGLYKSVLLHEGTKFYQVANITLRTIQVGSGQLKISANVRVFFGDDTSNEFLTYEFDDVPYNFITGQMSIKDPKNDVSLVGIFKPSAGTFEGDWFSTIIGKVGKFSAKKAPTAPPAPAEGILVRTLTGQYRGKLTNTNPQSNLPERATISLVTTQDTSTGTPIIKISGTTRLYLGDFESFEYVETKLVDVNFNFYNRYLTARTADYGLTYKGTMSQDGVFKGNVFADGIGEAAKADFKQYP